MLPWPVRMFENRSGDRRGNRSLAGWMVLVSCLGFAPAARTLAQAPRPEIAIKSEFVLRFPEFVQWPQPRRPLTLCLSASHPFGSNLEASASAQPRGKHLVVRKLQERESIRSCDVVYVGSGDLTLLDAVANLPILTVGDHPNFCQRGGIINLLVIDGKVRFEIDLSRARRAGLMMDSQLLSLATKVYGSQP
jgi:hypothetical protein